MELGGLRVDVLKGKLTDDDLDRVSGNTEMLIGRSQERYGYARDQAKREVDDFFAAHPAH